MLSSGIYSIIDLKNNKKYIGSAIDLPARLKNHIKTLKINKHHNSFLQNVFNKRPDDIGYYILEYVIDKENLLTREQYWMDFYQSYKRKSGMNICSVAGSPLGIKHTAETCKKLSNAKKGRKLSEEHKASLRGRKASPETRLKMSESGKGKKFSEEHRRKLSDNAKNRSPEHKEKIRQAVIGRSPSPETREKMRNSSPRRKLTEYEKFRLAKLNSERGQSEESIQKMISTKRSKFPDKKFFYDNSDKIFNEIKDGAKTRKEISIEYDVSYATVKCGYRRFLIKQGGII